MLGSHGESIAEQYSMGLKGNFLDVPTDCPQRDERLGWTGDAQMFIGTAAYLANVAPFFTKWLSDMAAEQRDDGAVPFVVPHVLGDEAYASAAWGDAAVICPWTVYVNFGDRRILERQYESMKRWVSYIQAQGSTNICGIPASISAIGWDWMRNPGTMWGYGTGLHRFGVLRLFGGTA